MTSGNQIFIFEIIDYQKLAPNKAFVESEYVKQLIAGDTSAFEFLYHQYKRPIASNLLRLLKDEELAAEVIQDLFIKVWEKRSKINPEQPFLAFLYTVAQNMVYDIFRKSARDERLNAYLMKHSTELYSHVEETIFTKENEQILYATIDKLPPQRKRVFMLFKIEGKSYQEIGEELGISKATINEHITKANRFIREQLLQPSSAVSAAIVANILLFRL